MARNLSYKNQIFQKSREAGVPVSGTFELTGRCNLNCRMCYIHQRDASERELMGKELSARDWIRLGREASDAGMLYLLLTGGEPLIRRDFSFIYRELYQMGLRISVNTNGTLLEPYHIRLFSELPPERINVSIYGSREKTYRDLCGWGKGALRVNQGIRMLKEAGIPLALNTTFTKWNRKDMRDLADFAKKEELPIRTAGFLFPGVSCSDDQGESLLSPREAGKLFADFEKMTLSKELLSKKRQLMKLVLDTSQQDGQRLSDVRHIPNSHDASDKKQKPESGTPCMAGNGAFWISYDGKMYPCGMLRDGEPVLQEGFGKSWKATKQKAGEMLYPEECRSCQKKIFCPFCLAVFESYGRDMDKIRAYLCVRTETYIKEGLR